MGRNKHYPGKRNSIVKYYLSTFSPVHRQSLAAISALAQTMSPDLSAPSGCPLPHQPPRHELMHYKRNKPEKTGKSDWMVTFCHEPSGDIGTCCTATLMPCVLLGKTHWRLKNISLGQDPHDWHASDGCNKMCWIHAMLGGGCCIAVVLTALQRARIRAQYRINGHFGYDCLCAIFCHPCILAQDDREVRAREGAVGLAKRTEILDQPQMSQPKLHQPMRYASPRVTDAEHPESRENRIFRLEGKKLQKRYAMIADMKEVPAEPMRESNVSVAEASRNVEQIEPVVAHVIEVGGRSDGGGSTAPQKSRGNLSSLTNCSTVVNESPPPTIKAKQPTLRRREKIRPSAMQQLSYVHDFTDSHVTKSVLDYYEEEEKYLQKFGIGRRLINSTVDAGPSQPTIQHALDDSSSPVMQLQQDQQQLPKDGAPVNSSFRTASLREHRLESCNIPESVAACEEHLLDNCELESGLASPVPPRQHRFASCSFLDLSDSSRSTPIKQHRISSCSALSPSSGKNSAAFDNASVVSGPNTPYKSKQHRSVSCIAQSPIFESKEHFLIDCAGASGNASPVEQHAFTDCDTRSEIQEEEQHLLDQCAGASGPATPVKQHRVTSCIVSSPSSTKRNSLLGRQHRISSCPVLTPEKRTMSGNFLVNVGDESPKMGRQSYEDHLHNLDDCLTPAQKAKLEADEKTGLIEGDKDREVQVADRREVRISDYASHESDGQYSLAQVLALSHENEEIGGRGEGMMGTTRGDKKGKGKDKGKEKDKEKDNGKDKGKRREKGKGSERARKVVDSEGSGISAFASYFGFGAGRQTDDDVECGALRVK
ncbi:DUF614 domain protein [Rutstroemia sp. NJR-2017a BBW]|nr:DUF614 domain protein [Rutstroemia sp. NJR-2017a BBW]